MRTIPVRRITPFCRPGTTITRLATSILVAALVTFSSWPLAAKPAAETRKWLAAWKETTPMLEIRSGAAHYATNGVIYMIGGIGGDVVKGKVGADVAASSARMFLRSTEYARIGKDGELSGWTAGPELNLERGYFSAAAHNNHLYVVGGAHGPYGKKLLDSVERTEIRPDGSLGPWVMEKNRLNIPRRCVKLAIIGDYLYAFGGFGGILLDTVERAEILPDGTLGEWLMATDRMTVARYIHGVERAAGGVFMIGGHNKETGGGIAAVEWSKPGDDGFFQPWARRTPLQTARYGLATATHNGFLYAIGGLSGATYLDSIERARIGKQGQLSAWEYTTPLPSAREGASALVQGDNIYLLGGSNQDGFTNHVSYATFNEEGEIGFLATPAEIKQYQRRREAARGKNSEMPHEGTISKHIRMTQYSYLQVRMDDGLLVWLAAPAQELREGERIRFPNGAIMKNFHSNSLNRDFPFIIFISEVKRVADTR